MTRPAFCGKIRLIVLLSFIRLALLTVGSNNSPGLVHCSSSYIDDYFLPTAKIALNKIQQSLSPAASPDRPPHQPNKSEEQVTEQPGVGEQRDSDATRQREQQQQQQLQPQQGSSETSDGLQKTSSDPPSSVSVASEPNTNEFVQLEVRPDGHLEPNLIDVSQRNKPDSEPTMVVSSTEATADADASEAPATSGEVPSSGAEATSAVVTAGAADQDPDPVTAQQDASRDESAEVVSVSSAVESASSSSSSSELPAPSTTTTATTTSGAPQEAASKDEDNQIHVKSADEAVRETELEAIAAVDASIGFGDAFATTADACYDEYGNARYCEPEFENVALERQVETSSECGHPPTRFCTTNLNERNDQIRNCHICDAQHPKKRHPSAFLTDMHNMNAPTCWVSAPIGARDVSSGSNSSAAIDTTAGATAAAAAAADATASQQASFSQRDNVTLTINLEKRYEITYMSLQFCSLKPDSLAIWKSADFGKSWSPWQFYSSQCARLYERPTLNSGGQAGKLDVETGQVMATCVNTSGASTSGPVSGRVAFSTLELSTQEEQRNKQMTSHQVDKLPALQDWMTATNIRIVLDRHQASWIQSSLAYSHHHLNQQQQQQRIGASSGASMGQHSQQRNNSSLTAPTDRLSQQALVMSQSQQGNQINSNVLAEQQQQLETSLTNPSDTYNYAVSDLTIGGRCKCNGHASRCVHNADGQLQCDCQHNTDGPDCERCLPLHHDRPWQRATQTNANPCQPCNCNGHSRKCRFDSELYLLSGKRSGGVCIDCKDNTTGRHCNYCKEGFTRDHTKPMSDQGACKACDCHPVGSIGKVCNHVTGQCPCKEGVTGLECNRCAPGYQQSSSPTEPCIKIPENDINYEPIIEAAVDDEQQTSSVSHQSGNQDQSAEPIGSSEERNAPSPTQRPTAAQPPVNNNNKPPANTPDNNRIDSVISSDELGPGGYLPAEQQPPTSEFDNLRPSGAHKPRLQKQHPKMMFEHGRYWYPAMPPKSRYGDYPGEGKQRHRPNQLMGGGDAVDMDTDPEMMPAADDQDDTYESGAAPPVNYRRFMHYPTGSHKPRHPASVGGYADYPQQMGPVRSIASLDQGHDQDQTDTDQAEGRNNRGGYGNIQDMPSATYGQPSETEANFNQIQMRPRYNSLPATRYHLPRQRHQQQQQQQQSRNRHRLLTGGRAHPSTSSHLNCAGCQARTKKLNAKQFCHLDYAVRALVISKRVSSDWTRFEVEIQDIFKSPSSSSLLQPGAAAHAVAHKPPAQSSSSSAVELPNQKSSSFPPVDSLNSGIQYGIQSDEPRVSLPASADLQLGSTNETASRGGGVVELGNEQTMASNSIAGGQPEHQLAAHRLRIGSVQSIWVPTEDVACKCPRLKLRSSYLLMGLVDTRENSATATQLDRHGVSMIWRPSLQEKLIKYQRLYSEGLCWRAA